jgi:hypothetical protein
LYEIREAACRCHPAALRRRVGPDGPPLVHPLPNDQIVSVQADLVYRAAGDTTLRFDLYRPKQIAARLPVLIIYNGFAMAGLKQRALMVGWARLVRAIGAGHARSQSRARFADRARTRSRQ